MIDYEHVGVSDRIVLRNFLKAGREFLNVKSKTNNLRIGKENETDLLLIKEIISQQNKNSESSTFSLNLNAALQITALKYGLVTLGNDQVCLWLIELLILIINEKFKNIKESVDEVYLYMNDILKSISLKSIKFCLNQASIRIDASENEIIKWLADDTYSSRVCQLAMDGLISASLAPQIQISPLSLSADFFKNKKTFAIVSEKTALINHHIYPFIVGKGDIQINIIGVHTSWLIPKSNLAKRAILYDENFNCFLEADLDSTLVLDYVYVVELFKEDEVETHADLNARLGALINPSDLSKQRADDKLWIRENKPSHINTPNYLLLTKQALNQEDIYIKMIETFLANSRKGVVVQPSSNTTEASNVFYFDSNEPSFNVFNAAKLIFSSLTDTNVLISEFKGNLLYKDCRVVFRFNVSCDKVTVAAYVGAERSEIVSLKGSSGTKGGYCERLDVVLDGLYEETSGRKAKFDFFTWNSLLNTAKSVSQMVKLALVGIDMVLELNNDNSISCYVLEVNARPGTLIFGEELVFDEYENKIKQSVLTPPMDENFWAYVLDLNLIKLDDKQLPISLVEWKNLIESLKVEKIGKNLEYMKENKFLSLLANRYGVEDLSLIAERVSCVSKTVNEAIKAGFDVNEKVKLIFSNGRDRYFGGHTDLLGLGGPTVNATTENEIIAILQESKDTFGHFSNSNREYKCEKFDLFEFMDMIKRLESKELKIGESIWNSNEWTSYLKGSLAYMLSKDFSSHAKVGSCLKGFRAHFNSSGKLYLESRVGSSSSSALTSAFVLGLNEIFNLELDRNELSQTDYGEFYLGKTAGCADKTTILNAVNRELILVSSIPERICKSISLPASIVVIMANSNIPRLNSPHAKEYLSKIYTEDRVDSIINWASSIMKRFGSFVFVHSVNCLIKSLNDVNVYEKADISRQEAECVLKSLETDNKDYLSSGRKLLLRELCTGGKLEAVYGYNDKYKRYNLIFKMLKLLPESEKVSIGDNEYEINTRKATLYGLSEIEKCHEYVYLMNKLNTNENETNCLNKLLELVRWSHNGDRAVVDYRNEFKPTEWALNSKNLLTNEVLDAWIKNKNEDILNKSGGFERSLPEFDEWADNLDMQFKNRAALRVSAAGLGGMVCVHTLSCLANDVISWLKSKGLSVKVVKPGPSCLVL